MKTMIVLVAGLLLAACGTGGTNTNNINVGPGATVGNITINQDASGGDLSLKIPVSFTQNNGINGLDTPGATKPAVAEDLAKIANNCPDAVCKDAVTKCKGAIEKCKLVAQ